MSKSTDTIKSKFNLLSLNTNINKPVKIKLKKRCNVKKAGRIFFSRIFPATKQANWKNKNTKPLNLQRDEAGEMRRLCD